MDLPPLRHPVLAPGVRVLRRGPDEVQVGLDPRRALRLRATGAVRRTLAVVTQSGPPADADPRLVRALRERGLVAEHPAGVPAAAPRAVHLLSLGPRPVDDEQLRAAGLRAAAADEHAAAGLLLAAGEPDRALLDPWVVAGLPHVVVRLVEGDAMVGPFVVPGRTACLRCLDAHHTDDDPRWPLLVAQAMSQQLATYDDATDTLLRSLALGWALADLRSHLAGERPATWSATLRLTRHLAGAESVAWRRHPECGCVGHP